MRELQQLQTTVDEMSEQSENAAADEAPTTALVVLQEKHLNRTVKIHSLTIAMRMHRSLASGSGGSRLSESAQRACH